MHASVRRPLASGREPAREQPAKLDDVQSAQQSAGNAAVSRVLQRKLQEPDAAQLREYYAFLVDTRDIAPGAYDKVLEQIIDRYEGYQEAATQLSFVLPIPASQLLPKGGLDAARDFTELVGGLGYTPYLAGGSAITLQGGRRPAGDFDFRIDATASLKDFKTGEGQTLVNKLNVAAGKESRRREEFAKKVPPWMKRASQPSGFDAFRVLGVDATIGTKNFFGQEVSLTISDTSVVSHGGLASASGLSMLSLADLLRDKLKTTISRNKRGDDSVKKVAQDLADGLIVAELLTRETTGTPELTMQALLEQLKTRVPGYVINNLELISMQGVSTDDVAARMLDRLVRTAQVHATDEGARGGKFESLARSYAIDIVEHVERLAALKAPPTTTIPNEQTSLEDWFKQWNTGPAFTPPKKPDTQPQPQPQPVVQQQVALAPDTPIAEVLGGAPDFAKVVAQGRTKQELQVLFVLRRVGGLRPLVGNVTPEAAQTAFGLGKSPFLAAFRSLKTAGLVLDSPAGLTLTASGQLAVGQIVWT